MPLMTLSDVDLTNKRVLIREDFNVPLSESGGITSDTRIKAALPTIEQALAAGAKVILMSHCGRPEEGIYEARYSLAPVATHLSELLNRPVRFEKDWLDGIELAPGEIVLCENVRFQPGELANDEMLSKKMAQLCDVFVMDAFACAHRAQASTHGVARFAPHAVAGPLLIAEIAALSQVLEHPKHPVLAIVGGSKVSTKLTVLKSLLKHVDQLIVGGGIANTFLAAEEHPMGKSLYEPDLIDDASELLEYAKDCHVTIPLPVDVLVATTFSPHASATLRSVHDVEPEEIILDIGPETVEHYVHLIEQARTILWNGPVGVFEFAAFQQGTQALAQAIAENKGFSVAGGGDTLAAIEKFKVGDDISYISTGGGAFLELLEGRTLPAIEILEQRAQQTSTRS